MCFFDVEKLVDLVNIRVLIDIKILNIDLHMFTSNNRKYQVICFICLVRATLDGLPRCHQVTVLYCSCSF